MSVLILTSEDDVTADMVVHRLTQQGTPVLRVDPADIPGRVALTARITAGGEVAGHITTDRQSVELGDIRSVWLRRPGRPGAAATEQREWVATETERAFYGALRATGAPWMNHPDAVNRSRYKPWQLRAAHQAGMRVPDTIVTTVPDDAEKFTADGPVIVKAVSGRHPEDPPVTLPTCRVQPGADFAGVAASATCLQREVAKTSDLRLTVVGEQMFPCVIEPEDGQTLDWRWLPAEECTWAIRDIPAGLRASVQRYMATAGLVYAALDFAIDTSGEFWFLEANASGQFGFVEITTGAPISQAIADWLTHPSPTRATPCPG
ncbi:alpha-L-glutamate ligase [Streptomyces sp. NBC_01221]|uniref:MvdC/MvdD family ATP grasp protein n=1 Tax=Streptomyces sp. NBC_01221 TaxID=2903782 RepID=UPI00225B100D|nr:alpha-L-glutamate ligase [Streptomyces sp. NBC_01221]MCX4792541.1 alpha-L-glutamate ligase [Streptomyces sp. NBC_01221]